MNGKLTLLTVWVTGTIAGLGLPGVLLLMAIESACVPVPSELIMPFAGYLVSRGAFSLPAAAMAGALGCVLGSMLAYGAGAWGGRAFFERYGRYVLVRRRDLDGADRWFARWGEAAVFGGRLLPIVRTFISLPAGIARMNFPRFVIYSFLGSLPWCFFLAWVGLALGDHWARVSTYFHGADLLVAVAAVLLFAIWLKHHVADDAPSVSSGLETPRRS